MLGDFSSSRCLSYRREGFERWLDGGVLAPRWGKEIAGHEMAVRGLGPERQAEPRGEYTWVSLQVWEMNKSGVT